MDEILQALALCKWAPSGGNTQPWSISIEELTLDSLIIRLSLSKECEETDLLMEANGAGALYSLGTLSHTAQKILSNLGWETLQDQFNTHISAYQCHVLLHFKKIKNTSNDLNEIEAELKKRRSNRGLFKRTPISDVARKSLAVIMNKYPKLKLLNYQDSKSDVARTIGKLENIRCQNNQFSKEFLSELHFKPSQSQTGLPSNTLGQPWWALGVMWLWKNLGFIRYQYFLGAQRLFRYFSVDRPIKHSGDLFAIQAENLDFESIYLVGQCLCENWFALVKQGYDVQIFGLPILSLFSLMHPNSETILSNRDQKTIHQVHGNLEKYGIDINKPCLLFRSGIARKPAHLSPRKPIEIAPNMTAGQPKKVQPITCTMQYKPSKSP